MKARCAFALLLAIAGVVAGVAFIALPIVARAESHIWSLPHRLGPALVRPVAVAWDSTTPEPTILVADEADHKVVRIDLNGRHTVIAGTGQAGFNGDNQAARLARLDTPTGVAVTPGGDVLIADKRNHRIRVVNRAGVIGTVAGTGVAGFNGDNADARQAQLNSPADVASGQNGDVIIADKHNHRVRKITQQGQLVTIAGTGNAGFNGNKANALEADLKQPNGVAVTRDGNIVIADKGNQRVRMIRNDGSIATAIGQDMTIVDSKNPVPRGLNFPRAVAARSDGRIVCADTSNARILEAGADGVLKELAGKGFWFTKDATPAYSAHLRYPVAVAATPGNGLLVIDLHDTRVRFIGPPSDKSLVETMRHASTHAFDDLYDADTAAKADNARRSLQYWASLPTNTPLEEFATHNSTLRRAPTAILQHVDSFRPDRNERAVLALRARMALKVIDDWSTSWLQPLFNLLGLS